MKLVVRADEEFRVLVGAADGGPDGLFSVDFTHSPSNSIALLFFATLDEAKFAAEQLIQIFENLKEVKSCAA